MAYQDMTVEELREELKGKGVGGIWDMSKQELIEAMEEEGSNGGGRAKSTAGQTRKQDELPPGKSATTREHDTIRRWAEARDAVPATVDGTEHGDYLGVLRFDFPGYGGESLREVSWDEWFATFDDRNLEFRYQDRLKDGRQSNFFRLLNPEREDA